MNLQFIIYNSTASLVGKLSRKVVLVSNTSNDKSLKYSLSHRRDYYQLPNEIFSLFFPS